MEKNIKDILRDMTESAPAIKAQREADRLKANVKKLTTEIDRELKTLAEDGNCHAAIQLANVNLTPEIIAGLKGYYEEVLIRTDQAGANAVFIFNWKK